MLFCRASSTVEIYLILVIRIHPLSDSSTNICSFFFLKIDDSQVFSLYYLFGYFGKCKITAIKQLCLANRSIFFIASEVLICFSYFQDMDAIRAGL